MNGHDHEMTGGAVAAVDPQSPLNGRVGAMLGRRVRDLLVEVRPAGLVLRGRADSYHAKQLAQHAAAAVTGLPVVANRIEVAPRRWETTRPGTGTSEEETGGRPEVRVLLASGDDQLRSAARVHLTGQGYSVATAADGVESVALLGEFAPDVVVLGTDLLWGGADGVLEHLRDVGDPGVPVVLLTSPFDTPPVSWGDGGSLVVSVLEWPVTVGALLGAVRSAIGRGPVARTAGSAAGEEAPPPPA